jgi:hypothetical protein
MRMMLTSFPSLYVMMTMLSEKVRIVAVDYSQLGSFTTVSDR